MLKHGDRTVGDRLQAMERMRCGDLPIGEALKAWPDKVIWMGFPGSVYVMGPNETKKKMLSVLRESVPGERLCVAMSTENIVSNENLLAMTSVLEKCDLPLTPKQIDKIEKAVRQ